MSLIEHCVDDICRHILSYEEPLPSGLPPELVDRLMASLLQVSGPRSPIPSPSRQGPRVTRSESTERSRALTDQPSTCSPRRQHKALLKSTLSALRHMDVTSLSLSSCNGVTDDWLLPLAGKSLTSLDLSSCAAITDQGLLHLTGLQDLRKASLHGCLIRHVNVTSVVCILNECCTAGCTRLRDMTCQLMLSVFLSNGLAC